jgi:hypothetical protein
MEPRIEVKRVFAPPSDEEDFLQDRYLASYINEHNYPVYEEEALTEEQALEGLIENLVQLGFAREALPPPTYSY